MVVFTNVVTNTGNTEDHFTIQLQNVSFPSGTARFTLYVNNTSQLPDSYKLAASTDETFAQMILPTGVTIVFKDESGAPIAITPEIAAGGSMLVYADVTVSEDAVPQTMGAYFRALAVTTGAYDIKLDAVHINVVRQIVFVPNSAGTAFAGDTIVYTHTITNQGNVTSDYTFTLSLVWDYVTPNWSEILSRLVFSRGDRLLAWRWS